MDLKELIIIYKVGIIMGSDSDLMVMADAAKALEELGIEYEMRVISAHRTPEAAAVYAETARGRGLSAIIAGAGMAAHLAGVIAAHTALPVIGVPIKSGALNGVDALYAMAQMPPGVPVACVAVDGARNAGLLAAQIIGATDAEIYNKFLNLKENMKKSVEKKDQTLVELGYEQYAKKRSGN